MEYLAYSELPLQGLVVRKGPAVPESGPGRVPPPGCPPGCPALPSPATQATLLRFLLCAIPENSTQGVSRWCSTACKCEVAPPTHPRTLVPRHLPTPLSETAFKWVVVTDWMASGVALLSSCVLFYLGATARATKYRTGPVWP